MEQDLLKIKKLLPIYIKYIIQEYPFSNGIKQLDRLNKGEELVTFNDSETISFFVKNGTLLLPKSAYSFFSSLKRNDKYGINPNNKRNVDDYLDTNTTYLNYINHLIEGANSVYDYFEESLLHEVMHICGSRGGSPIEEGINELKTRELAQKNNIKIAAYGYSKEVEVAKRFQIIVGKEIMDEMTFIPSEKRKAFLAKKTNNEIAELYDYVSKVMLKRSIKYYKIIFSTKDPYEKAKIYDYNIDYTDLYSLLDNYVISNKKL